MTGPRRMARGVLPAESEEAFQQKVTQFARFFGWRVYHTHRSDRSEPGFPDLVMVRGPRLVFAELKREKAAPRVTVAEAAGRVEWLASRDVTTAQAEWLQALAETACAFDAAVEGAEVDPAPGLDVYLWRPSDWETIEEVLKR